MKKLFLFIVWFSFSFGTSQIINVPDVNFKNLLLQSSTSVSTAADCFINSYYKIDVNENGEIEASEALSVCGLAVINANITDLTGIEAFTNLKYLACINNSLSNINLSTLVQLETLLLYNNQLPTLNINNLTNLKLLDCRFNNLTSLNFGNNPMLEKVFCNNNQLTSLDFINNPLFNELDCMNNPNLSDVNISNGTMQLFGPQTYYNQCWSGCPNLAKICADSNEMSALQTYLTACNIDISAITFNTNCVLANEEFGLEEVAIYPNPAVDNVNITSNENIKTVELIDIQGRMLQSKTINKSNTNIDVSGYCNGVYFVKVTSDKAQKSYKLIKN